MATFKKMHQKFVDRKLIQIEKSILFDNIETVAISFFDTCGASVKYNPHISISLKK